MKAQMLEGMAVMGSVAVTGAAMVALLLGGSACGVTLVGGEVQGGPAADIVVGAGDAAVESDASPVVPADAGSDADCKLVTTLVPVAADTMIAVDVPASDCGNDLSYGQEDGLNVRVGGGALRFELAPAERDAIANRRAREVALELDAFPTCTSCGGQGLVTMEGSVVVRAMRSDWDEGAATGRTGADACRRTKTNAGWGMAAVATSTTRIAEGIDITSAPLGSTTIATGAQHVRVPLALPASDARTIAVWVRSTSQLVVASREAKASSGVIGARLAITTCAPLPP